MGNFTSQESLQHERLKQLYNAVGASHYRRAEDLCNALKEGVLGNEENVMGLLHIASDQCDLKMMQLLLDKGMSLDCPNCAGESVLHEAVVAGRIEVVTFICQYMKNHGMTQLQENKYGQTAIHVAAQHGQVEVMEMLITTGYNVSQMGFDLVKRDAIGVSALEMAVSAMARKSPSILVKVTQEVMEEEDSEKNNEQLFCYSKIIEMLFTAGVDRDAVNTFGENMLRDPALQGKKELVDILCRLGVDINHINPVGNTVLHDAVMASNYEVVEMLVQRGADINLRQHFPGKTSGHPEGGSAIDLAIEKGSFRILQLFCLQVEKLDSRWLIDLESDEGEASKLLRTEVVAIAKEALRQRRLLAMARGLGNQIQVSSTLPHGETRKCATDILTAVNELIDLLQSTYPQNEMCQDEKKKYLLIPLASMFGIPMVKDKILSRQWCHGGGGAELANWVGGKASLKGLLGIDVRRKSGTSDKSTRKNPHHVTGDTTTDETYCDRRGESGGVAAMVSAQDLKKNEPSTIFFGQGDNLAKKVQGLGDANNPLKRRSSNKGKGKEAVGFFHDVGETATYEKSVGESGQGGAEACSQGDDASEPCLYHCLS